MSTEPLDRTQLPMAGHTSGKRSPVTCHLKCANACFHPVPNTSDNPTFREIAGSALTRRAVLGLAGAGAVTIAAGTTGADRAAAAPLGGHDRPGPAGRGLSFTPIASVPKTVDDLTVPDGWTWEPLVRWGDPVVQGAPAFDPEHQSAAAQALQFGYNNDYTDVIETSRSGREAVLVCNHEYVNPGIM